MFPRSLVFPALVVLGGLCAGVIGGSMAWLVHQIQHLATGLGLVSPIIVAGLGGVLAGLGWWWLRRQGPVRHVEEALLTDHQRLPLGRTTVDGLLQLLVVGSGASLGREQAPRQVAAAAIDALSARWHTSQEQRRRLIAAAAGAGLAAVYNVPLAGILFSIEVLPARRDWRTVVAAITMSIIATVTAWPIVGNQPIYQFPSPDFRLSTLAWVLLAIPLAVGAGRLFTAMIELAQRRSIQDPRWLPVTVGAATALVVAVSTALPGVTGNGEEILRGAFAPESALWVFGALLLAKPLLTAFSLGAGAVGGTMTPALAIGAALGAMAGLMLGIDPDLVAVFALIGAAGVLAVVQHAPIFAAIIAWELTGSPLWTLPLLLMVTGGAWLITKAIKARGEPS
ncbi:chloride channel protein [Corynebacterium alimapuense]|uniref:Chloride channel protein n=1 Tax=Corynebacterium alimapuense TaxID=1576874 RepID=A0A3M8K5I1_9CORY|nr:chloride channel protein [Corynebacterium alimapuense]RNE48487.1 chloride channel protein [Corynebacterium alimapuense]